ncbi:unnamed protein product, partial [marine sediment metagenome]
MSKENKIKVVITGPIRNSEHSLAQHLKSITDLDIEGLDVSYLYYTYNNIDNTLGILTKFKETVSAPCIIL